MNKCKNYLIPCPWALTAWSELSCFVPGQEVCDMWREKYKKEAPEEYKKAMEMREKLNQLEGDLKKQELERMLAECYR